MRSQVSLSLEMEHLLSFFPFPTCVAQVKIYCLRNMFPFKSPTNALFNSLIAAASIAAFDSLSHTVIAFHVNTSLLTSCNLAPFFTSVCGPLVFKPLKLFCYFCSSQFEPCHLCLSLISFFFLMSTKPDIPNLSSHLYPL